MLRNTFKTKFYFLLFSYRGCVVYLCAITIHSGDFTVLLRFYCKVYYQSLFVKTLLSRSPQPWDHRKTATSDFRGYIEGLGRRGPRSLVYPAPNKNHQNGFEKQLQLTLPQCQQPVCTPKVTMVYVTNVLIIEFFPLLCSQAIFANVPSGRTKEKFWLLPASSGSTKVFRRSQSCSFCKNGWCEIRVSVPLLFRIGKYIF